MGDRAADDDRQLCRCTSDGGPHACLTVVGVDGEMCVAAEDIDVLVPDLPARSKEGGQREGVGEAAEIIGDDQVVYRNA